MPTDPTLVLDMPFMNAPDASIGGAVRDFSGYGNHGTPTAFVGDDSEFVDDHLGQAIQLVDPKYLDLGNIFDFTIGDFSFEIIMTPTSLANNPVIIFKGATSVDGYNMQLVGATSDIRFRTNQGGANQATQSAANTIILNNVNYIFITRQGPTVKIYNNGIEVAYAAQPAHINPLTSANNFRISTFQGAAGFGLSGNLNRFRTWERAVGDAEIYQRYIHAKRM